MKSTAIRYLKPSILLLVLLLAAGILSPVLASAAASPFPRVFASPYLLAPPPVARAAPPSQTPDATLRIINESEQTIRYILIVAVTDTIGENAILSDDALEPGEEATFTLPTDEYHIGLLDCNQDILLAERNVSLVGAYELHFTGPDLCGALNREGMALFRQAQYRNALQKLQDALTCYRKVNDRKGEGTALNDIGTVYNSLAQYQEALDHSQQALAIMQEVGDRAGESSSLHNIGFIYASLGQYQEALDYYQQSLAIIQEIGDRAREGISLNNIGDVYNSLAQYQEALDYFQQALAILQEIGDRVGEGTSLHNIGFIYANLGQYQEALDYFQQALTILQEIGDRRGVGNSFNSIGLAYNNLGQYQEALDYSQQAMAIMQEIGDRAGEGVSFNNIGLVYDGLGQYQEALDYFQQSLVIRQEISDQAGEGINLNNIGIVYHHLGQYQEALDYYQQAMRIRHEIGDRRGVGESLNNIGLVYADLGQYQEALDYSQQSLAIMQEIGDWAGEGISLNSIGIVYHHLGQYQEAMDYFQQSLAIDREVGDQAGEGVTLNNIGIIHDSLGQYQEALDYYQQALAIQQEIGDRAVEGISLCNIGSTYEQQNQPEQALLHYEQAMTVFESVRATAGSEAGRASFIAQHADLYDRAVNLYHAQGQDEQAFFTAERGRARAFLDSMSTGHIQLSDDTAADLLARELTTHAARQTARDALSRARAQQPPDAALITNLESQLAAAEEDHAAALDAIAARHDQLAALVPGRGAVPELSDVQALLDENGDTILLSYWVLEDQTLASLITHDSFHIVALGVSREDLSQQIRAFRQFPNLNVDHPESAVTLYNWLIAPLEDHLVSLSPRHLVIIPHDVLHYLPFTALTDGERYLIDNYAITYLPSAGVLRFIQENAAGRTPEPLLVLGNPVTADPDLPSLRYAEQEAQTIADLYSAQPLLEEAATESALWEQASQAGVVHIAAHGGYNPYNPLYSAIALAPDAENDGLLEVHEVYGLDLSHTDLVVLSACETQLGELNPGDELVGLTRAFIFAGTPSVIASLWSVDDESTGLLMERFYTHLQESTGKAEALRQAQIEMREEYPNPYYWSAFVLSGDRGEIGQVSESPPSPDENGDGGGICPSLAMPLTLVGVAGLAIARRDRLIPRVRPDRVC